MTGVLLDTSVWVDHFRRRNHDLVSLILVDMAMVHPMVLGELACGTPPVRAQTLADIAALRTTQQATMSEVRDFIDRERLFGLGCGLADMVLLASVLLSPGVTLWSLDKRLSALAGRFKIGYEAAPSAS